MALINSILISNDMPELKYTNEQRISSHGNSSDSKEKRDTSDSKENEGSLSS